MPIAGIAHQRAVRALEKVGFRIVRQSKHIVTSDGKRVVTIPRHDPVNAHTMLWSCAVRDSANRSFERYCKSNNFWSSSRTVRFRYFVENNTGRAPLLLCCAAPELVGKDRFW